MRMSTALIIAFALLGGCGGGGGGSSNGGGSNPPPPAAGPAITSLYPSTVVAGHYDATVSVLGTNFVPGSSVKLNGTAFPTSFLSAGKLRIYLRGFDIAVPGAVAVTVTNPAGSSGGTPATSPAATLTLAPANFTVTNFPVTATALVWNAAQRVFYFLVPATASSNPSSIGVLDPATTAISYFPLPGGTPDSMQISDDDQFLFLYSAHEASIQRWALPGVTHDLDIPTPGYVYDVKVQPGASHTIAVSIDHQHSPNSPADAVLIYDDGVARAGRVPWFFGLEVFIPDLSWGEDGTQLFGREATQSDYKLYYFVVNDVGVFTTRTHRMPTSIGGRGVLYDRSTKLLYLGNGLAATQIVDPVKDAWAGNLDAPGLTLADPTTGKAFQLFYTQGPSISRPQATIASFDLATHNLIEAIIFEQNYGGIGPRLIRYGTDGLAFLRAEGIFLVNGAFVSARPAAPLGGPDAPAVTTVNGQRVVVVDALANDIVADPVRGHLYLSIDGYDRVHTNQVAELDPQSGRILATHAVTTDPDSLAVSDDGRFLYVANLGAGAVERYTLPGLTPNYYYPLGWNEPIGWEFGRSSYIPVGLQVAPGLPNTVAVNMGTVDLVSPTQGGGIIILDDNVPRPNAIISFPGGGPHDSIQWGASASTLYAVDNESSGFGLMWMSVDASGIQPSGGAGNAIRSYYANIHYDATTHRIYTDDGLVLDPSTGAHVGDFGPISGIACVDGALNKAFYLTGGTTSGVKITSYSLQNFSAIGTLELPDVAGGVWRFIRWGNNGLAFNGNDGEVWIISGSFVR